MTDDYGNLATGGCLSRAGLSFAQTTRMQIMLLVAYVSLYVCVKAPAGLELHLTSCMVGCGAAHLPFNLRISLKEASVPPGSMQQSPRSLHQAPDAASIQKPKLVGDLSVPVVNGRALWQDVSVRAWPGLYTLQIEVQMDLSVPYYGLPSSTMDAVSPLIAVHGQGSGLSFKLCSMGPVPW